MPESRTELSNSTNGIVLLSFQKRIINFKGLFGNEISVPHILSLSQLDLIVTNVSEHLSAVKDA